MPLPLPNVPAASSRLRHRFNGVDRKNLPPVLDGKEVFEEDTVLEWSRG